MTGTAPVLPSVTENGDRLNSSDSLKVTDCKVGTKVRVWHRGYKKWMSGTILANGSDFGPNTIIYESNSYNGTTYTTYWSNIKDIRLLTKLDKALE